MHILIVEDDRVIAENLYDFLESRGHTCDFAASLGQARQRLAASRFDTILLDRNLPDGDGAELLRDLRDEGKSLAVLVLSARDALEDKLDGFAAGADDYLAKPFALKEVEARLLALQRRAGSTPVGTAATAGPLAYDPATREICLSGQALALPPKAVRLAELFLRHPGRLFSRQELELAVWGREQEASDNLRSVLNTLRRALGDTAGVRIVNVHGLGYKLVTD
jgi:DNA-binding response OmpR family regulator